MMAYYGLIGVPVAGSRKLKLRAMAQQATQQRRDLMHETAPLEEKKRSQDVADSRIAR